MYCDLPKLEIWTYFVIWVSGVVYSLYNVYLAGNYYKYNNGGIFSPGWSFLNQKKDVSDFEWAIWSPFLCTAAPWVCVHLLVAEVVRYACKERCHIAQLHDGLKRSGKALLHRHQREGDDFLGRIIAMDETWTRSYEPNLKRQSNEWKHPGSPHPKKVRPTQSAVKETFIVAYDIDGLLPIWYLTVSMLYLLQHVGLLATVSLAAEPCLMYLLLQLRSRAVVYVAGLFLLVLHNMDFRMVIYCPDHITRPSSCSIIVSDIIMIQWVYHDYHSNWLSLFYDQHYMLTISSAWIYMRSQSFCLDRLMSSKVSVSVAELVLLLGYCFYLPMLFLGPLVLFEEFEAGILKPYAPWTVQRMKIFILNILRYMWWMCFLELFLHFIYVGALQMDLKHVRILGVWAHYGMGFSMGIMFQLKYVVTYGLSCTVARAEQIKAPAHPKCISRIHLYSDMWRHFDQGLYFFLRKYIYAPVLGDGPSLARRLLASFVCFSFVYAWHKVFLFVLIWSALNYAGVSIEIICKAIGSTSRYQLCEKSLLSTPQNIRRFHAFIATPLFMMSALSNFYFFAGMEIGNHFLRRFFEGKKWNSLHQNPQLIPALPRKSPVAAFRLATGHDCLAKHLHRIGIYQSPNCPLCNSDQEMDSEHLKICASVASHDNIFEKYWSARGQMTLLSNAWH
ncbi:hypothetical protein ANN_24010 [Periplaneta americana]|uniref:Acyltransferase required for palmitoylation of hedgehog hh family of secreted signaling n=1 Tax=Periplaneta americana TaxID=6978 RepID=A0ABQ8S291_PERAM|nr:hypothetical protein ANN_24010 [Periplaneta americana]